MQLSSDRFSRVGRAIPLQNRSLTRAKIGLAGADDRCRCAAWDSSAADKRHGHYEFSLLEILTTLPLAAAETELFRYFLYPIDFMRSGC